MNKMLVWVIPVIVIGLAGFAVAYNFNTHYKIYADDGWNLFQGFGAYSLVSNFISGGDVVNSDVTAVFAYLPNEKKYVRIYPNPEVKVDDGELLNSAFWVYLKKGGWIEYSVDSEWAFADNRQLKAGWNFVGVTKDIYQIKVKDFKGTCNIEKIGSYQRGWKVGTYAEFENELVADTEQDIGRGLIIKVSSDCNLNINGGNNVSPPQIPN